MKILSSIGPNAKDDKIIDSMIEGGTNIFRFNLSHGDLDIMKDKIKYIRGKNGKVEILADLQGNKVRIDKAFQDERKVQIGEEVCFSSGGYFRGAENKKGLIPLNFQGEFSKLYWVRKILMKDGTMEFSVIGVNKEKETIKAVVEKGGIIRQEKGVNVINMDREGQTMTPKDKEDIAWALRNNVDIICISFVAGEEEVNEIKETIKNIKRREKLICNPQIWAKIECREGVENFKEISKRVDGIVIGRGDLCSEIPMISVPPVEEYIIEVMRKTKKDIIIATHVLDSMKYNKSPNLSEIESIYNFIKKGVTGFMLCGETNVGKYPVGTVRTLKELINMYYENLL